MAEFGELTQWGYAGPVARAYEHAQGPVEMIQGPLGGGKSTASAHRCLRVATWQHPSPVDGIRKAKIVCVAPTYRRAWDQVIPTFFETFPREGPGVLWQAARNDPADYTLDRRVRVGGGDWQRLQVIVQFRAIREGQTVEDFFRGYQFTALWLPEADTNVYLDEILSLGASRAGRYPLPPDRPLDRKAAYVGIFGDSNAPVIGSPFHRRFHLRQMPDGSPSPKTDRLWRQPSGFSSKAENLHNLNRIRKDYYQYMAGQLDKYDVNRLLKNMPGFSRDGEPVHPNFDPDTHCVDHIEVDPFSMVIISVDAGSNTMKPAAVFWQRGYGGQWRAFAEIYLPEGEQLNTEDFCARIRATLQRHFPNRKPSQGVIIIVDPAAMTPNAASQYNTAVEIQAYTRIEVQPAPTNDPASRRGALDARFKKFVAPGEPMIVIDKENCPGLVSGLGGGFHFKRFGKTLRERPEKNAYSHVCEAAEYGPLGFEGMDASASPFIRPDGEEGYGSLVGIYEDGRYDTAHPMGSQNRHGVPRW